MIRLLDKMLTVPFVEKHLQLGIRMIPKILIPHRHRRRDTARLHHKMDSPCNKLFMFKSHSGQRTEVYM